MSQRLSSLIRWVVAGLLAGLETAAIAQTTNRGFLDVGGTLSTIDVPGASDTRAMGINNAGHIVGIFRDSKGTHGFLDVGGTFSTIDVPGASFTHALGINNAGHIVGSFVDGNGGHGFLDVDGIFSTIDVPRAYWTEALG